MDSIKLNPPLLNPRNGTHMNSRLKNRLLVVFAFCFFVSMNNLGGESNCFGQTPIAYGDLLQDSVTALGQINQYFFTGVMNDVITFWMVGGGAGFTPVFELYDPTGRLLQTVAPPFASNTARLDAFTLPSSGTYTILAFDNDGQQTSNYGMYRQRTFSTANTTP